MLGPYYYYRQLFFFITAQTGAASEEPRFTWSSSESVTIVQGENLTLECAAHGVPAPQLSWEKYGGHVPYGRHSLLLGKLVMFRMRIIKRLTLR